MKAVVEGNSPGAFNTAREGPSSLLQASRPLWTAAAIETAERKELRARRRTEEFAGLTSKDLIDETMPGRNSLIRGPQATVTGDRDVDRPIDGVACAAAEIRSARIGIIEIRYRGTGGVEFREAVAGEVSNPDVARTVNRDSGRSAKGRGRGVRVIDVSQECAGGIQLGYAAASHVRYPCVP